MKFSWDLIFVSDRTVTNSQRDVLHGSAKHLQTVQLNFHATQVSTSRYTYFGCHLYPRLLFVAMIFFCCSQRHSMSPGTFSLATPRNMFDRSVWPSSSIWTDSLRNFSFQYLSLSFQHSLLPSFLRSTERHLPLSCTFYCNCGGCPFVSLFVAFSHDVASKGCYTQNGKLQELKLFCTSRRT